MADNPKVLGQALSNTGTWVTLYTAPTFSTTDVGGGASLRGQLTQTVISSLVVCETNGGTPTFSVAVMLSGETGDPDPVELLFKSVALTANQTKLIAPGITLGPGDMIKVDGSDANVAFNLFGTEVT